MKQSEVRYNVYAAIYTVRLYESIGRDYDPKEILASTFSLDYEEVPLFARELFVKSLLATPTAIEKISPLLNSWTFDRLNILIQAMLIGAYTERNIMVATDKKVVINEAVNYAKEYSDFKDFKFVNAVLDKVLN